MSTKIVNIFARQILDSRGMPTVEADVILANGSAGRAAVPSGASTGSFEAFELRDTQSKAFQGKSVKTAVENVNNIIAAQIRGLDAFEQRMIDHTMIQLDGSDNKYKLGANAILAVSLATAKAAAASCGLPLYQYLGGRYATTIPVPMLNIINGGKHADNKLQIQEFMIMPTGFPSFSRALQASTEIFYSLKGLLKQKGLSTNVGDEGGFAPNINDTKEAIDIIIEATDLAGYNMGKDIFLALDCASTEFFDKKNKKYEIEQGKHLSAEDLLTYYQDLVKEYPIISIEDAFAEDDFNGYALARDAGMNDKLQLVGDDLFVTNPKLLQKGINEKLANSILIKPNQIGTLTETFEAINLAKSAGYTTVMSHRSGETEDTTISHLAVAFSTGQIKTGSLSRSDRLAKYNELLRIEEELGNSAVYAGKDIKFAR